MIKIKKINESFAKVFCDDDISMNLAMAFSTMAKGYEFDQRYLSGIWDGRIYNFSYSDDTIPLGLVYKLSKYLSYTLKQKVAVDADISVKCDSFSDEYIRKFVRETLKHTKYVPHDYQCRAVREMIYHRRITIECATGSGKSFIMWIALCMIMVHYKGMINKFLIIVPNVHLVTQLISEFNGYSRTGDFSEKYICNYRTKKHNLDNMIHITNYQAIFRKGKKYFDQFDSIFADECHNVSGSEIKNFAQCSLKCVNAVFKIGLCGYITDDKTLRLNCEGMFGPIKLIKRAHELIEDGTLSPFKIVALTFRYKEDRRYQYYRWINDKDIKAVQRFQKENDFLNAQTDRRAFIGKLAATRKGNTLILVKRKLTHGDLLYNEIKERYPDKHVYYVHGGVDVSIREQIRTFANDNDNVIIIATIKTFSEGIDIKNLHNVILAELTKAEIALIQMIGRALRKNDNKDMAIFYDLSDDLRLSTNHEYNYALKHLLARVSIYEQSKFDYETTHYDL